MKRWGFLLLASAAAIGASEDRAGAQAVKPVARPPAPPPPPAAKPALRPLAGPPQTGQCVTPECLEYQKKISGPITDNVYNRADPKHGQKSGHPKDNTFVNAVVERGYGATQNAQSRVSGAKVSQKSTTAAGGSRAGGPKPNTWGAEEAKAQIQALQANPTPTAATAGAWTRTKAGTPGANMASCDDYVYEKYYEQERWLDAVYACGKDQFCKADVTLNGPASIAGHNRLKSADSAPTSGPTAIRTSSSSFSDTPEISGKIPRNAFFAGTGYFLTDSLVKAFATDPTKQASVQRLVSLVRTGVTTYVFGQGSGGSPVMGSAQGFSDEWDFHRTMLTRTQHMNLKPGDFREYGVRGDSLFTAIDAYFTAAACGAGGIKCLMDNPNLPNALGQLAGAAKSPWEEDAFVSRAVHGNVDRQIATDMQKFVQTRPSLMSAYDDGIDIGSGLAFPGLQGASSKPEQKPPAGMVHLATAQYAQRAPLSPAVDNTASPSLDKAWAAHPPKLDPNSVTPRLQCVPPNPAVQRMQLITRGKATNTALSSGQTDTGARTSGPSMTPMAFSEGFAGEVAACEVVNLILDEWSRADQAPKQASCFDSGNYACDWSPKDFQKRWINNFVNYGGKDKNQDFKECMMVNTAVGFPRGDWKATEAKIKEKAKVLEKIFRDVPVLRKNTFGQDLEETQSFGNDTIGAGYHYGVGWELPIFDRLPKLGVPCSFGARVHGDFNAFFYAFGSGDEKLIDISLGLNSNDENKKADDKASYKGHIKILGNELFSAKDDSLPIHQTTASKSKPKPKTRSGGDSYEIFEVDFPVWIVVVKLYADVGFDYHGHIKVSSHVPKIDSCADVAKLNNAEFNVKATYSPSAGADLDAGIQADIAGVLGAKMQCNLNLVELSLPFRADAGLLSKKGKYPYLGIEQSLDAQVKAFNGDIWLYITGPFDSTLWGKEIAGWDGMKWSHSLFNDAKDPIELDVLTADFEPKN